MLLKGFQIMKTAIFVEEGALKVVAGLFGLFRYRADQTYLRDAFHVDVHALAGISHLLWHGDILRVWQLHRHLPAFSQKAVQSVCVAALPELC